MMNSEPKRRPKSVPKCRTFLDATPYGPSQTLMSPHSQGACHFTVVTPIPALRVRLEASFRRRTARQRIGLGGAGQPRRAPARPAPRPEQRADPGRGRPIPRQKISAFCLPSMLPPPCSLLNRARQAPGRSNRRQPRGAKLFTRQTLQPERNLRRHLALRHRPAVHYRERVSREVALRPGSLSIPKPANPPRRDG